MKNLIFMILVMIAAISCANVDRSQLFKFSTPYGVSKEKAISDYLSCRRENPRVGDYSRCMVKKGYKPINRL